MTAPRPGITWARMTVALSVTTGAVIMVANLALLLSIPRPVWTVAVIAVGVIGCGYVLTYPLRWPPRFRRGA